MHSFTIPNNSASLAVLAAALAVLLVGPVFAQGAGEEVAEPTIPAGTDLFALNLAQTIALSARKNFEVVGHSYLKGEHLTQFAKDNGMEISRFVHWEMGRE